MYSIKITGVSGVGKTTLAKLFVHKRPDIVRMSFGEFLYEYNNDEARAKEEWESFIAKQNNLVLIEEHLEIGKNDLIDTYVRENTKAIFLIEPSVETVLQRRKRDMRQRDSNADEILEDIQKSRRRAVALAKTLHIPLVLAEDENIEQSIIHLSELIARVERKEELLNIQQELEIQFIEFDLSKMWNSHWLINSLRQSIAPLIEKKLAESDIPFDPQDLEHQSLFYLTTFDPGAITDHSIENAVTEQYAVIRDRLLKSITSDELNYIFRGLKKFYPDLNSTYRLQLIWKNNRLIAVGEGREFEVEFKKVTEKDEIVALFSETLHYVHQARSEGDIFAFYFKGDRYPWAIETCEEGKLARKYKRDALLAYGIDPNKAIEITRLYTLPGSPLNSISIIDRMVRRHYKQEGIEALFTCTMPSYSKTRATTTSGGIDKVLCIKNLRHYFVQKEIEGREYWIMTTQRWLEKNQYKGEVKQTHESFTLLPKVDVFTTIQRKTTLHPLPQLKEKVIFFT